jgi:hypothetical protein
VKNKILMSVALMAIVLFFFSSMSFAPTAGKPDEPVFKLTILAENGAVTLASAKGEPFPLLKKFGPDEVIVATAKPAEGHRFVKWEPVSGFVTITDPASDVVVLTLGSDAVVKAVFARRVFTYQFDSQVVANVDKYKEKEKTSDAFFSFFPMVNHGRLVFNGEAGGAVKFRLFGPVNGWIQGGVMGSTKGDRTHYGTTVMAGIGPNEARFYGSLDALYVKFNEFYLNEPYKSPLLLSWKLQADLRFGPLSALISYSEPVTGRAVLWAGSSLEAFETPEGVFVLLTESHSYVEPLPYWTGKLTFGTGNLQAHFKLYTVDADNYQVGGGFVWRTPLRPLGASLSLFGDVLKSKFSDPTIFVPNQFFSQGEIVPDEYAIRVGLSLSWGAGSTTSFSKPEYSVRTDQSWMPYRQGSSSEFTLVRTGPPQSVDICCQLGEFCAPYTGTFEACVSGGGDVTNYDWKITDPNNKLAYTASGADKKKITYTFDKVFGTYTITVTVTDAYGVTTTVSKTIKLKDCTPPPPPPPPPCNPPTGCLPDGRMIRATNFVGDEVKGLTGMVLDLLSTMCHFTLEWCITLPSGTTLISVVIDQGVGTVGLTGSRQISWGSGTKTYTITVTYKCPDNSIHTVKGSVTVPGT